VDFALLVFLELGVIEDGHEFFSGVGLTDAEIAFNTEFVWLKDV